MDDIKDQLWQVNMNSNDDVHDVMDGLYMFLHSIRYSVTLLWLPEHLICKTLVFLCK